MKRLILPLLLIGCAVLLTGAAATQATRIGHMAVQLVEIGGCQYVLAQGYQADGYPNQGRLAMTAAIVHHAACPNRNGHKDSAP